MASIGNVGITFAPTTEQAELAGRRGVPDNVREAIEILSLHLPAVPGGRELAPRALLEAPGSGGADEIANAVVQSVLRTVLGGGAALPAATPPGATRAVGQAPVTPGTAAISQSAQSLLRATPRVIPGFRPGFGGKGFLGQLPGESAFEAIQRKTTPATRQEQLAAPIARSLAFQEEAAQQGPEFLPQFRERLGEIEQQAGLPRGFLGPLSTPKPQRTFADVVAEVAAELQDMFNAERTPTPAVRTRPVAF